MLAYAKLMLLWLVGCFVTIAIFRYNRRLSSARSVWVQSGELGCIRAVSTASMSGRTARVQVIWRLVSGDSHFRRSYGAVIVQSQDISCHMVDSVATLIYCSVYLAIQLPVCNCVIYNKVESSWVDWVAAYTSCHWLFQQERLAKTAICHVLQ